MDCPGIVRFLWRKSIAILRIVIFRMMNFPMTLGGKVFLKDIITFLGKNGQFNEENLNDEFPGSVLHLDSNVNRGSAWFRFKLPCDSHSL